MQGTDRVVVSAESVREFYMRQVHADPAKVDVIYNAVDFAAGAADPCREPTSAASAGCRPTRSSRASSRG